MRRRTIVSVVLLALGSACAQAPSGGSGLQVVASVAPLAEIAARVGGDHVTITTLAPPGAEAHEFEPGPRQIEAIGRADLVVYLGGRFQPAVVRAVRSRPAPARLDLLRTTPTVDGEAHLWLNPEQMRVWTREVRDRLSTLAPASRATFTANATAYLADLLALDAEFRTGTRDCAHRTFVTTHAAFGEIALRYDLQQRSLAGFEPESEPDPAALAEIVRVVRREGLTTVFTEPGAPPRVAATLGRVTGARIAVLDPLETTPARTADTYLTRMRANLAALREALRCR